MSKIWQAIKRKLDLFFSDADSLGTAFALVFIFFFAIKLGAPLFLGPRGDLLSIASKWAMVLLVSSILTGIIFIHFRKLKKKGARWFMLLALLIACMPLYAGCEIVLYAADYFLPFYPRHVVISQTYFVRGSYRAFDPESGAWHLVTSDGEDLLLRASVNGSKMLPGPYDLQLSHFKSIVMGANPSP